MASDEESLRYSCEQCGAQPGNPCTYIWPMGLRNYGSDERNARRHTKGSMVKIRRVGTPTLVPHNVRRAKAERELYPTKRYQQAYDWRASEWIAERRYRDNARRTTRGIAHAENDFERREAWAVFQFLLRWGNVFEVPHE